jgi:hypothetical protein
MSQVVVEGTTNFSHLTKFEEYKNKSTERYALTITLDDDTAERLESNGVKVREYDGKKQRKFTSQYEVRVVDGTGQPFEGEVPYNSTVKVAFKYGNAGEHGVPTYLNAVQVVEAANGGLPPEFNIQPAPKQDDFAEEEDIPF